MLIRIRKDEARKLFYNGEPFYVLPSKMHIEPFKIDDDNVNDFDYLVECYADYYCNEVNGKRMNYYREV